MKGFLNPVKNTKLLSYGNDIFLLNLVATSGIMLQYDDNSETYRIDKYSKILKNNHAQKCCVMVEGKIYEFDHKIMKIYNLKKCKVRSCDYLDISRRLQYQKYLQRAFRFHPQEHSISVCRCLGR